MDFTELPVDGQAFEQLVRELLFSRGLHVAWSGRGADGGRDLVCRETLTGIFGPQTRTWLVQCKHNAHSGISVSHSAIDDPVSSCAQHGATGYLLVCSTQPSSGLVARLEGISRNEKVGITATYWDAVTIERLLSNPRDWAIAQRFMPNSCEQWRLYATTSPNHFIAHYKGYVFHLTNRIGSETSHHLPSIEARIEDIEELPLPPNHFVRPRAVWYDDKNGGYRWYVDYMRPHGSAQAASESDIQQALRDGWALEDGQVYSWDVRLVQYLADSDHYDRDHYEYYTMYLPNFLNGAGRDGDRKVSGYYAAQQYIEQLDAKSERNGPFDAMVETLSKLPFMRVIRAVNAHIEDIHRFSRRFNWQDIIFELHVDVESLFNALLILDVSDDDAFHRFMSRFPNESGSHFRLGRVALYLPDRGQVDKEAHMYDLRLSVFPTEMANQWMARNAFNDYFRKVTSIAEVELGALKIGTSAV
ncbi:MAG TPA: restriction endonuclease [Rhizobiaceae bacterium]|nr:restriction endonuclease [Rhizobiaceae bacterium]